MAASTQYRLLLFDITGEHRPVAKFVSSTPFHTVHVGERFDDTGWDRLNGIGIIASSEKPVRYTVHSIKHLISKENDVLIVSYCLNLEPYHGGSSPVWKD